MQVAFLGSIGQIHVSAGMGNTRNYVTHILITIATRTEIAMVTVFFF